RSGAWRPASVRARAGRGHRHHWAAARRGAEVLRLFRSRYEDKQEAGRGARIPRVPRHRARTRGDEEEPARTRLTEFGDGARTSACLALRGVTAVDRDGGPGDEVRRRR